MQPADLHILPPSFRRAFTLLELLFVVSIIVILCCLALPHFLEQRRPRHSPGGRVRADLRSLATGVESYFVDNNVYPAWSADPAINYNGQIPNWNIRDPLPTFITKPHGSGVFTLTTPIAYVTSFFTDPFCPTKRATFCYWTPDDDTVGWILWSPGPDLDYDLTMRNIAAAYDPATTVPNDHLIERTYDPTNGTTSNGDVYRIKE
jgi:prepilin-type N-terminal cleavage/methylation domain-containing protein